MSAESTNSTWKCERIGDNLYFETLFDLYEILVDEKFREFRCQQGDLTLYPYKNCETGKIITAGKELQFGSLPSVTMAIAYQMAGLPWSMPHKKSATTVKQEMAAKRAWFDISMGADVGKVCSALQKTLKDAEREDAYGINGEEEEEEEESWSKIRKELDGDAAHDESENFAADSDAEDDDEDGEDAFESLQKKEDFDCNNLSGEKIEMDDDNEREEHSTARKDTFQSLFTTGVAQKSSALNDCIASLKAELQQQHQQDDPDADIDDKLLLRRAQTANETQEVPHSTDTVQEWNGQMLPVVPPSNISVDRRGKIANRTDLALNGRSAKEALETQRLKEEKEAANPNADPFATRKTMTQVAAAELAAQKIPKTVADELRDFNLPPGFVEEFSKQKIGSGDANASDVAAEYPASIDDIMHMAAPFKSKNNLDTSSKDVKLLRKAEQKEESKPLPASQKDSKNQSTVANPPTLSMQKSCNVENSSVTLPDFLRLFQAQTAQMQAMVDTNRVMNEILQNLLQ